jgi:hypothetical protein
MVRLSNVSMALACAALAGCSAARPVSLSLTNGEPVRGAEPTTVYTSTLSGEQKHDCRASYTGASASSTVLLEVRCPDGQYGIGTGELRNARLVGGIVRMRQDGREARVVVN